MPMIAIGVGFSIPRTWRARCEDERPLGMPPELFFIFAMNRFDSPDYRSREMKKYSTGSRGSNRARKQVTHHD